MDPPSDLIQSVSRALRVLEVVGATPDGVSPKAVARRAGLRLSTTYHLLRTLAYEGYLLRLDSGDYVVGLNIADRFRDLVLALSRPPGVEPVLRDVAEATGLSAYLARFMGGRVVITAVVEAPGSPRVEDLVPGFDDGAHATALGKALLATLTPSQRAGYIREMGLRRFTPQTVADADTLEAELRCVRDDSFTEVAQFRDEVACAARLVATGDAEDPWWAVGVSAAAPTFARQRPRLDAVLRRAAAVLAA